LNAVPKGRRGWWALLRAVGRWRLGRRVCARDTAG